MKESFIMHTQYSESMKLLNMEQRGILFTAIFNYETGDDLPEMDSITYMAYLFIKGNMDREEEKEKSNRENGKKGGRPKKTPVSDNFEEEKGGFEEKKGGFEEEKVFLTEKEKGKERSKENPKEKEYTFPKEELPPYNPPVCLRTDGSDEAAEEFLAFMREHPKVRNDITNPSLIASVDFKLLAKKISESRFLQTRYSLGWLIGNYRKIVSDAYKDLRGKSPPQGDRQIDFLRKLYEEFSEEDEKNAEEDGSAAYR